MFLPPEMKRLNVPKRFALNFTSLGDVFGETRLKVRRLRAISLFLELLVETTLENQRNDVTDSHNFTKATETERKWGWAWCSMAGFVVPIRHKPGETGILAVSVLAVLRIRLAGNCAMQNGGRAA